MRIDVVVDLETLGTDPKNSPVIQIGAVAVLDTKIEDSFYSLSCGVVNFKDADVRTVEWWLQTNPHKLAEILASGNNRTEEDLICRFMDWLTDLNSEYDVFLWGKGPEFDNSFLKAKCEKYNLHWDLSFRNDRCIRTIGDFHTAFHLKEPIEMGEAHDAYNDALYEAQMLIQVREEMKKYEIFRLHM